MSTADFDVLVVGSGFGGAVAALRLTEKGYRVGVLEAGRRFGPETLPKTSWNLRNYLWFPRLGMRGIQRINLLRNVLVLSGSGVGGGSLVYANTLYRPFDRFYDDPVWASITDWRNELAPCFDQAERMLGVNLVPFETASDRLLRDVADRLGVGHTHHPTPVGIYFGVAGTVVPDPYFGGAGPTRRGCIRCAGCMTGCRYGAKNTLDTNYLYLAEQGGCRIFAEEQVVDVRPLAAGGYEVTTERPGTWKRATRRTRTCRQVVFSASALGTQRLLHKLKEGGSLPRLSDRLGHLTRTNSEAIVGAIAPRPVEGLAEGVAITSSIHPDEQTHIEPVRYGKGSNVMGLLSTIMVDGGGRLPRPLRFLLTAIRHPVQFVRSLSVHRWSERGVILLVMQSVDNSIRVVRRRLGPFSYLTSEPGHGTRSPTWIPVANEAARIVAEQLGGQPNGSILEALADIPTTAHLLGGCAIGAGPDEAVVDPYQRLFGYEGLHVADGSVVPANLGANPSLTITAMSERAMSFWPNKGEPDPRPPLGSAYRRVAPVLPRYPAVPAGAAGELRFGPGEHAGRDVSESSSTAER